MAGTGFFDSWSPVDTNNPVTAPVDELAYGGEPEVVVSEGRS